MSIIIRLQNLPLSAKSGDVRRFFGGLRIPEGGVHILGGEKGDAFIAFSSDDDACLAMKKDGHKLQNTRVRLFLSSSREMKEEIERLTKGSSLHSDTSRDRWESPDRRHSRESGGRIHERSVEQGNRYKNFVEEDDLERFPRKRSEQSLKRKRPPSPFRRLSPKYRSSSLDLMVEVKNNHSWEETGEDLQRSRDLDVKTAEFDGQLEPGQKYFDKKRNPDDINWKDIKMKKLERKIHEAISQIREYKSSTQNQESGPLTPHEDSSSFDAMPMPYYSEIPNSAIQPYTQSQFPVSFNEGMRYSYSEVLQNPLVTEGSYSTLAFPEYGITGQNIPASENIASDSVSFCIIMSGLDPSWGFGDVQSILKKIFVPNSSIKFEIDSRGLQTGTAFVKLANQEDFLLTIAVASYVYQNKMITIAECPLSVFHRYFPYSATAASQTGYIRINNLPYAVTFEEIVLFFQDLQIVDIYIFEKDDKRDGSAYVSFATNEDKAKAFYFRGRLIGPRRITIAKKTHSKTEIATMKRNNIELLDQLFSGTSNRRTLCASITGLSPIKVHIPHIGKFFSTHHLQPDAIHLILTDNGKSSGRAFVEFANIRDFEAALSLNGEQLGGNPITLKQVLYDEMSLLLRTRKIKTSRHHSKKDKEILQPSSPDFPERAPHVWVPPDAGGMSAPLYQYPSDGAFMDADEEKIHSHRGLEKERAYHNVPKQEDKFENESYIPVIGQSCQRKPKEFAKREGYGYTTTLNPHKTEESQAKSSAKQENNSHSPMKPVKFEVKNKPPKSAKMNEVFDSSTKEEPKRKLTKLTPEKEHARVVEPKGSAPSKNSKTNNPPKKNKIQKQANFQNKPQKQGNFQNKNFTANKNKAGGGSRGNNRYYNKSQNRQPPRFVSPQPTPPTQNIGHQLEDFAVQPIEHVVQASGVHPSVSGAELEEFFYGFDIFLDSFMRRYSDMEVTGDVRVSFRSRREAERAVQFLTGRYLAGYQVELRIV